MLTRSPLLSRRTGVVHGFTTAAAGDLRGPDRWPAVTEALGQTGAPVARAVQVHGNAVVDGDRGGPLEVEADAVIVSEPGVFAAVRVADCVPVLMAAPGAVAAVHAGWRGTVARIAPIALQHLCVRAGCRPADVAAAIGPCVSVEAYEVGQEVLDALDALGEGLTRGRHADLKAANAHLLREAGIGEVEVLPDCTILSPGYHSYRRDGPDCGRLAALIALC